MADTGSEIIMRIVNKGAALPSECTTEFARSTKLDTLRTDFEPGKFSELITFHIAGGVSAYGVPGDAPNAVSSVIENHPVEYTRLVDTASTLLFQSMVACETLDSISIAKRRATGGTDSGEVFFRLDFTKVLITSLIWRDIDHGIEESGTFIYRKINIQYRPQKNDGELGTIIPANWSIKA